MAEIPMVDSGVSTGTRPREVTIAGWLILLESLTGLVVGGINYMIWEDDLSLLGIVIAFIGFWLYTMILKQDYAAWMMAVIFNIIAIFLYAAGYNFPGVFLSLVAFLYLIMPNVKVHFVQK
ncbi:MAG: hypothetical protein ACP6KW_04175 [Candidatus Thorarchaeota archaeon]